MTSCWCPCWIYLLPERKPLHPRCYGASSSWPSTRKCSGKFRRRLTRMSAVSVQSESRIKVKSSRHWRRSKIKIKRKQRVDGWRTWNLCSSKSALRTSSTCSHVPQLFAVFHRKFIIREPDRGLTSPFHFRPGVWSWVFVPTLLFTASSKHLLQSPRSQKWPYRLRDRSRDSIPIPYAPFFP